MVENLLHSKIGIFQSDGGGEFLNQQLPSPTVRDSIFCFMSSYPQQNGLGERKHMHIIELGLSMLFQGHLPQKILVETFFTANFLSNLLPATSLATHLSPYEVFWKKAPDYTSFVFLDVLVTQISVTMPETS